VIGGEHHAPHAFDVCPRPSTYDLLLHRRQPLTRSEQARGSDDEQ
jgi:hypothetical protein